jgi:hypothetical protein
MDLKANKFNEKIKTIKDSFFSALDDFQKYYVFFNKNPEVDEYQNFFANSKGQLQGLNSDMFLVTNNIQSKIKDLDADMQVTSNKLKAEKDLNGELLTLINRIQTTQDGSAIMIDDAKDEYNILYYKNWELFIGILIFLGISIKMLASPSISSSSSNSSSNSNSSSSLRSKTR